MGLQSTEIVYFFSAGIDYRRQNLSSVDVRYWRLQTIPTLYGLISLEGDGYLEHCSISYTALHQSGYLNIKL